MDISKWKIVLRRFSFVRSEKKEEREKRREEKREREKTMASSVLERELARAKASAGSGVDQNLARLNLHEPRNASAQDEDKGDAAIALEALSFSSQGEKGPAAATFLSAVSHEQTPLITGKPPPALLAQKGRGNASLIYEPRQADQIGVETLLDLAENGLLELVAKNARFADYGNKLFSRKALSFDRETMRAEEVGELNKQIHYFLRDVSPHLLDPAALNCVEYLVRKYNIHKYNVHSVLYSCLCYHRTDLFRKIVSILYVRGTKWSWVEGMQKTDAAFERSLFTKQCIRNPTFLNFVLQTCKDNAQDKYSSSKLTSFLFFVISEYIAFQTSIAEELLVKLLSYCVFPGLSSKSKDSQSASLLLTIQLSQKLPLSSSLVGVLFEEICRCCHADLQSSALQVLVTLCATQKSLKVMPPKAVKFMMKSPDLVKNLKRMNEYPQCIHLWKLILPSFVEFCGQHVNYALVVKRIVEDIDFSGHLEYVVHVAMTHVKNVLKDVEDSRVQVLTQKHPYVGEILNILDLKYGDKFDTVLNKTLPSEEFCNIEKDIVEYFGDLFAGTLRQPMGDKTLTLQAAIDSAQPHLRKNALTKLLELYQKEGHSTISSEFIHGALLRRIHDDDESISFIAFKQEELLQIPPQALLQEVKTVVKEAFDCEEDTPNKKKKYVKAKLAIKFLLKKFCSKHKTEANSALSVVFPALLIRPNQRKLGQDVLKIASRSSVDLFRSVLSKKKALKQFGNKGKSKKSEFDEKSWKDLVVNQSTIVGLTEALCKLKLSDLSALLPALAAEKDSENLLLLVVYCALQKKGTQDKKRDHLLSFCWDYVKRNWDTLEDYFEFDMIEAQPVEHWRDGYPPLEHLKLLWEDSYSGHAKLFEAVLFLLLGNLSMTMTDYLDILTSALQLDPREKCIKLVDTALESLCRTSERDLGNKKVSKESILMQVYYNCHVQLDKDAAKNVRANILWILINHLQGVSSGLTKRMEEHAVAKKKRAHKHLNGNGNALANGSSDVLDNSINLCIPWLLSALCEDNQSIGKYAIENLAYLSNIFKTNALKVSPKLNLNVQSLSDFIDTGIMPIQGGLVGGHLPLSNTLETFCSRAKSAKQDQDDIVSFLLDASVRYPYKEIAVNLVGSMANVGSNTKRIGALNGLLKKELDKYINASFDFANDSRITGEDIDLLSNILKGLRIKQSGGIVELKSMLEWFDSFIACMHFPSKHELSWKVRKNAIESISEDFFNMLSDERKAILVHSLAFLASKDDTEIVQSVAREKLEDIEIDSKVVEVFLMGLINECSALGKRSEGDQKSKRSKKTSVQEVQNRFKWVRERLSDSENLGLNSTILALEALHVKEFKNMSKVATPLLKTLELLTYLHHHQSVKDKDTDKNEKESELLDMAICAGNAFSKNEVDVTSQTTYGLQLGLETLCGIARSCNAKSIRIGVLGLSLKCIQLVEQRSIHEVAFDNLVQVVHELPKKDLESHASIVLTSIMDTLKIHTQWKASNKQFFVSILSILKPFLSHDRTSNLILDEISKKVTELRRADQQLFFALAQQTWQNRKILSVLLSKIFEQIGEQSKDVAELICEQYSGSQCLEAFDNLLCQSDKESLKDKLTFTVRTIAASRPHYSKSDKDVKMLLARSAILQINKLASSGESKECLGLYYKLLAEINNMSTSEDFIKMLVGLCNSEDKLLVQKALELLDDKVRKVEGKLKPEISAIIFNSVAQRVHAKEEEIKQAALVTLESSLKYLNDKSVLSLIDTLLLMDNVEVATSEKMLLLIGSSVKSLKSRMIPYIPRVADFVLTSLKLTVKILASDQKTAPKDASLATISAGFYAFDQLASKYGGMMGPYLENAFELCKTLIGDVGFNASEGNSVVLDLLACLSKHVPVRILLPSLLKTLDLSTRGAPLVAKPFVEMLGSLVTMMDHSIVQAHHFDIVNYILSALDSRRCYTMEDLSYASVECSLVDCFVALVMKLSEASFRPVFLHILDWSTKGKGAEGDILGVKLARNISFFHLIIKLTEKLRSIFVPYFRHMIETCCSWLDEAPGGAAVSKKKRTAQVEESDDSVAIWTLKLEVIHALKKCFSYDTVGFTEESNFDELLPVILNSLNQQPSPSISAEVERLGESLLNVPAHQLMDSDGLVTFQSLDIVARETAECLIKMAIAGNNDIIWKRFNNKVLMATRSEKVRIKLVSIEVVSQLAHHLKEDYVILVAETVPFIAELLEDVDQSVQIACKDFVKKLEDISGEDLKQYL